MNLSLLQRLRRQGFSLASCVTSCMAALLAACSSTPPAPVSPGTAETTSPSTPAGVPPSAQPHAPSAPSLASTAREYRHDAATHLYKLNSDRIYKGRLPPLLYAIGVLDVELDRQGAVRNLQWKRAPRHAPEVMAEIEQTVREAAPYPVPARMGKVVYTDVWLWHKSGRFQLDTLTEGQD